MSRNEMRIVAEVKASGEMLKDCKELYGIDWSKYTVRVEEKTPSGVAFDLTINFNAKQDS